MTKIIAIIILTTLSSISLSQCLNSVSWPGKNETDVAVTETLEMNCFAWNQFLNINQPQNNWTKYKTKSELTGSSLHKKCPKESIVLTDFRQASGHNDILPVGDDGLTWYKVFINPTAENYFSRKINRELKKEEEINFPFNSKVIKSAWVETKYTANPKDYLTRKACICITGHCRNTEVALTGMHIIHKTQSAPQWIWTTFEHMHNAPLLSEIQDKKNNKYLYFDSSLPPETGCQYNCIRSDGKFQLVREREIHPLVRALNRKAHKIISENQIQSPLKNYNLINTLWPQVGQDVYHMGDKALPAGGMTPDKLSNITLESYVQSSRNCMDCHQHAVVESTYSKKTSDYSFLFGS